jgi:hypothetical protein
VPVGGWSGLAGAVDPGDDGFSSEGRDVGLLGCAEESTVAAAALLWSYNRCALTSAAPEALDWTGSGVTEGEEVRRRSRTVLSLTTVSPAPAAELDVELGPDCAAGFARRSGTDDADKSRFTEDDG